MTDQGIKAEDLQVLFSINPLAAEQLKTIAATRERDELKVQLASVKVCQCDESQLPLLIDIAS
jgi:flagellar motor switch protein FliM